MDEGPSGGEKSREIMLDVLGQVIYSPDLPGSIPEELSGDSNFIRIYTTLLELRKFCLSMARGDLSPVLTERGFLAGTLKTLQANLRNLTWQAQMIASGDLSQRVDFMGEFSDAFNAMIEKLQEIERERSRIMEDMTHLAITDPLTELYNRRHFLMLARKEMARSIRFSHPLSVVMMDIDFFKHVNDTYGHIAGDRVLNSIAEMSRKSLRDSDAAGRYGGEELIFMLPETGPEQALRFAERLRKSIETLSCSSDDHEISVTVSLGVASLSPVRHSSLTKDDVETIIHEADIALYRAKEAGRNRVMIYGSEESAI